LRLQNKLGPDLNLKRGRKLLELVKSVISSFFLLHKFYLANYFQKNDSNHTLIII